MKETTKSFFSELLLFSVAVFYVRLIHLIFP